VLGSAVGTSGAHGGWMGSLRRGKAASIRVLEQVRKGAVWGCLPTSRRSGA